MFVPPENRIKGKKVNFMATCLCDAIFDKAAINSVELLKKFGAEVEFLTNQTCCGQPAFNSGDFASARAVIEHTMKVFGANDYPIVIPSGSCAAMLFHSSKIWEFCDYLVNVLGVEKIGGKFKAKVAVHNSCHSKGSGTPEAMKKLLTTIEGLELVDFDGSDDCCGFGGTFSVVMPELSAEMGEAKVKAITAKNPDLITAADTSCLMHQKGIADKHGIKYPAKHVAQLFYEAMKNGGLI